MWISACAASSSKTCSRSASHTPSTATSSSPRYPPPHSHHGWLACSYLTLALFLPVQSDVVNSKLIRNLMQLLVNTVLERAVASYEAFSAPLPPLVSAPGGGGGGTANAVTQDVLKVVVKKVSIRARRLFASGEVSVSAEVLQLQSLALVMLFRSVCALLTLATRLVLVPRAGAGEHRVVNGRRRHDAV